MPRDLVVLVVLVSFFQRPSKRTICAQLTLFHFIISLLKAQEELNIAHIQAARSGGIGGVGAFSVGTSNESKRDEEDRARRERERKKLLTSAGGGGGDDNLDADIDSNQNSNQALKLCNKIGKIYTRYKPLRADVSKIEQRFGTSVASYFHFYQWMFLNSIIVWSLYAMGFGYHLYLNTSPCVQPDGKIIRNKVKDTNHTF